MDIIVVEARWGEQELQCGGTKCEPERKVSQNAQGRKDLGQGRERVTSLGTRDALSRLEGRKLWHRVHISDSAMRKRGK